jgi:hypothetical protein
MIYLNTANNAEKIIVTLTELTTISPVYYLFVFTHVLTKRVVNYIPTADASQYPERYNEYDIDTSEVFEDEPGGEWHYVAYQQDNDTNTDPDLTDGEVENGKMILTTGADLEFTKYEAATTYKSYNG